MNGRRRPVRARRRVLAVIAVSVPAALTFWIFISVGRLGFNPTDDGYVLAQAYRVLHGEVPHRDFISPRPLGSAYVHLIDFALPLPLMEASRLVAAAEVVLYSTLLAALVFGCAPPAWGLIRTFAAGASALVNLHCFPLLAWYTIDGLVFLAAGFLLLRDGLERGRHRSVWLGLLSIGCAALTKQSFAPACVLALGWLAVHAWVKRPARPVRLWITGAAVLAAPGIVYLAAVAVAGGSAEMITQLASVASVRLFPTVQNTGGRLLRIWLVLGALGAVRALRSWVGTHRGRIVAWIAGGASAAVASAGTVILVALPVNEGLILWGHWGTSLFLGLAAAIGVDLITRGRLDAPALVILAIAWMTTLSWGYYVPNLMGGSVLLCLLNLLWRDALESRVFDGMLWRGAGTLAALVGLLVIGRALAAGRAGQVYSDLPASGLTAEPGEAIPALGRIRTSPGTAAYLTQLAACVRAHPARRVAVIPDNPFIYPALGLRNPLPIDWLWGNEMRGSEPRVLEAARRLEQEGDYLVMVQTVPTRTIAYQPAPDVVDPTVPIPRGPLEAAIAALLSGTREACGSFIAIHAPPRS